MDEIQKVCSMLEQSPDFLINLLNSVSFDNLKSRRIEDKWTAHEHVCHVCVGEKFGFHKRLDLFQKYEHPIIEPLSGNDFPPNFYYDMNLNECLNEFKSLREKTISLINDCPNSFWEKEGRHPEYKRYTPKIMLNHLLMHDYWHFYRIEELLLANDGCIE